MEYSVLYSDTDVVFISDPFPVIRDLARLPRRMSGGREKEKGRKKWLASERREIWMT